MRFLGGPDAGRRIEQEPCSLAHHGNQTEARAGVDGPRTAAHNFRFGRPGKENPGANRNETKTDEKS